MNIASNIPIIDISTSEPSNHMAVAFGRLLWRLSAYTVVIVALWAMSIRVFHIPDYIVPAPSAVWNSWLQLPTYYARHALVTISEATAGALLGFGVGFLIGILLRYGGVVSRLLNPLVIASQVFPKEALAPVFLIVFGFGIFPKIIISALICFFPVAISTHRGLMATPNSYDRLMKVLGATPWQRFIKCQLPFAAPFILSSARICTTLSVIGAIVGEFVGSNEGLGHVIRAANAEVATERIYAALILLGIVGGAFYGSVVLVEHLAFRRYLTPDGRTL